MIPVLFVLHPVPKHGVWRWAIYHTIERAMRENPRSGCINAGLQPTKAAADDIGQQCLYSILSFASLFGRQVQVTALDYDYDLVPDIPDVPLMAHQGGANFVQMGV